MSAWQAFSQAARVILFMSLAGSVMTLALTALRPLIKRRVAQSAQQLMWVLVLFAFFMPLSLFCIFIQAAPRTYFAARRRDGAA